MSSLLTLCLLAVLPQDPPAQQPKAPPRPMPVPRYLVQHRGETRISIDGNLEDWPASPPLILDDMRQITGTALGAWRGAHDFAGRGFVLWDAEALYFGFVVRDDWHRALTKDSPRLQEIPPADSVVLTLDPQRDSRTIGRDDGRRDDREYWLADVEGQGTRVVAWDRFRGTASFAEGGTCAVTPDRKAGTTTYEVRIPWADIVSGEEVQAGRVLDLQVVLNDFDEATDSMPQTRLGWTFGAGPVIDPGLLGSILLVPEGRELPSRMPDFPPPTEPPGEPVPPETFWVEAYDNLKKSPPVPITVDDSGHPSLAGGIDRLRRLESLEHHLANFPRVDYLEYLQRCQRRMRREVAGLVTTGVPFFWQYALADVRRRVTAPPPERGFALFRLPEGGWFVRSKVANFAIDPRGANVESEIGAGLDFVLLTSPFDPTRRSDQLLIRMTVRKRPFYTHARFHLPAVDATKMSLVEIGQSYTTNGLKVTVFGRKNDEGLVSPSAGFLVEWPNGSTLMHAPPSLREEDVAEDQRVDVLILSPRHPRPKEVAARLFPGMTVLGEMFEAAVAPFPAGRIPLTDGFALQNTLMPHASIILAPGESITAGGDK